MVAVLVDVTERIAPWIYQRLSTDPTMIGLVGNRIYRELAPQGSPFPYVTYAPMSGQDVTGQGGAHLISDQLWLVKVTGRGDSYSSVRPIIDRIFQLLHEQGHVQINGAYIAKATREQIIPQGAEYIGSERLFYSNQQFRIMAHPL